jgi:hypothetical protein
MGVKAVAILPVSCRWSEAAKSAVVKDPPEPIAIKGNDVRDRIAFTRPAGGGAIANWYVAGSCSSSFS